MTRNLNFSLDFECPGSGNAAGTGSSVARVRVDSACSYSRENAAPLITTDCTSADDFEEETNRLKNELDAIANEARRAFSGEAPRAEPETPEEPKSADPTSVRRLTIRDDLRVRDRMTSDVKTLGPNDKIQVADELMKVGRFRHIVVLDEDTEVIGVLSQSDICLNALAWAQGEGNTAHQRILESLPVKEVMRSSVETIGPDSSLADAAKSMIENKIGCLPVTEKNRLVGIITEGDFLSLLTDARYVDATSIESD